MVTAEQLRLAEEARRTRNWQRWGPYLSERQWGTVREDYSADGSCWEYFPHDHARSRAYRWGEDGILGICDRECRLCFALALWNGQDPILKERLFGLNGHEGNHGEDVKELYFYLDSTPTHSYMKALYRYPQRAYPYDLLTAENRRRGREKPEFEVMDTGIFEEDRYFDVFTEYAKKSPNDIQIRITVANRGPERASLHLLPTLWFRNTWSWGRTGEGYWPKPNIQLKDGSALLAEHASLGRFRLDGDAPSRFLFTENETNMERLFQFASAGPYVKDAFHHYLTGGHQDAVNPQQTGTKAAAHYVLDIAPGESAVVRMRLVSEDEYGPVDAEQVFADRMREAAEFYERRLPRNGNAAARSIARQAYAGLLWSKQFYHYSVRQWLEGDPAQPAPPASRWEGRNEGWQHLYNRDVISMPDKWEYPWYAAWDLAFHTVPLAKVDPNFSKQQLVLMLREWYMHPNGQIPAYEFAFSDVNPPVHAWACWRVYKVAAPRDGRDRVFLARVFHKLLINFTWWVNRKDVQGKNIFAGGFLGLDNIGLFDRSQPLSGGGALEQADGTAWMAFYCLTMLSMALELAREDPSYEDVASKFFEHFVAIADAINTLGGHGLWNEEDGFYYDQAQFDGVTVPLRVRSLVGLLPLVAVEVLESRTIENLPGFRKRMDWFLENRKDLAGQISYVEPHGDGNDHRLLAIPTRERLTRVLRYLLDENEFLSPYGIRSLSKYHDQHPYVCERDMDRRRVAYEPGESQSGLFGGNSNWRGPIWFPVNYLLIEALERYHHFYGDSFRVECPTGSGKMLTLCDAAREISRRLGRLFLPDEKGRCPWQGERRQFWEDANLKDLTLFHEYFNGDTGKGLGASHQTGWTALVIRCLEDLEK